MKKVLLWLTAAALFAAGVVLVFFPAVTSWTSGRESREEIDRFQRENGRVEQETGTDAEETGTDAEETGDAETGETQETGGTDGGEKSALLEEMRDYNSRIYQEHQTSLKDAWSFEENIFDLQSLGIQDDMAGYITIEAMDLQLPLYIGATEENMQKGAAVLGQTSMPVGGENTNCVIAAHRGYRGVPMFREIERLQPGDLVQVTNFWGTINYRVVKSIVVNPDEIEAIKIMEGQDLVTLVSCHPYKENYLRYIVYCVSDDTGEEEAESGDERQASGETAGGGSLTAEDIPFEGVPYVSSESAIREEQMVNRAARYLFAGLLVLLLAVLIVRGFRKRKGKRR